jgi:D-amino-acid N-acetyltransferase
VTWFPHLSTASIEPVVYLNDLFVDPTQRNSGIGGKLIDHVYKHSKAVHNAKSVYWHTQHFNHRGQLLYVKKGTKTDFVQYEKVL